MSNKETKVRVANAFRAMKALGISEDKVKPVLKSLLKLYDKNWELIEEENYRALADAIFERDESEAEERSKKTANDEAAELSNQIVNTQETEGHVEKEAQATEEPERPLKRLRRRYQNGQTSSLNTPGVTKTPLVRPKEEPNELPETNPLKINGSQGILESPQPRTENIRTRSQARVSELPGKNKGKQPVSPKSLSLQEKCDPSQPTGTSRSQQNTQLRTESRSQSHTMRLRDRGTGTLSSQIPCKEKTPVPESSSHALCLKEPKVEPGILLSPKRKRTANHALIVPKDEPVTSDMLPLDVPIATVHSDNTNEGDSSHRNGKICGNGLPEPSALQSLSEKETTYGTVALNEPKNNSEPAMISGDCSTTLEIASSPSGEVKISLNCNLARGRPDFHMPSLEAVVKVVDDKCLRSPETLNPNLSVMNLMKEMCQCFLKLGTDSNNEIPETLDVSPTIGLVDKSNLNGSVDSLSGANLTMPKTPLLPPPCNGINDGSQPNKMDDGDEIVTNDMSLEVVKQAQVTTEIIRSPHDVVDIAKGQEKVVITLVNDVNDECPPSFYYIPQNAAFQNAYVNFSLARIGDNHSCSTCSGDCLSLSIPCACANETGGEFAYTPDGLVKEELLKECISMNRDPTKHCQFFCKECPLERSKCEDIIESCKGHLVRKFIKECWWKCGCNKQCGNRVVQRGITRNLQVFMTPGGKGWGLRTLEDLPKGAFVCEYVGEVLTNAELFERVSRSPEGEKHSYPVLLDADWCAEGVLKDEEALCLDATYYGNVARFINHRCYDSTLVEIPVEVETPDHHYYHLAFFTTRKMKAMEELTWDYGIDFDDHEHPIKAFRCQCGSKFCRNIKRSRLLALCERLRIAWDRRVPRIVAEVDSEVVCNLIKNGDVEVHPLGNIIQDVQILLRNPWRNAFQHTKREDNKVEDFLAKMGHDLHGDFQVWEEPLK
ncbi:hypothetical protein BUALT_Bualt02G0199900 [Buddleja alternifolia]|uniref:Inactive histone-lysine N-methyltransferase SUVR2 n=1 Tax=Buddleja alternifolia TaxID=168488 RepID=A0AAV6Y7U2_9LAMI|nr:hypothetical protein BUALT_Bualt02G0199900 [Buddleja alternifolia]